MKKGYSLLLLTCLVPLALCSCSGPQKERTVSVPLEHVSDGQSFDGWGTSLCWWANRVGYSDALSQKAADLFFGPEGLCLNIMRYNIGGGDDPAHHHITRTDSAIPGWTRWDASAGTIIYDEDADHNQLNVLKRCFLAAGKSAVVEVFSNSPPYYMTVSGCSSGGENPGKNNLREDAVEDFADYLAHVTRYIDQNLGIRVTSLSPMNEPGTSYWQKNSPKQEGCHFDPGEAQSRIITACKTALDRFGLGHVILAASDETDTGLQMDEYFAYSSEALQCIGRINTHSYGENRMAELGKLARDKGIPLWMSEVDGGSVSGASSGEMGPALWLGQKIIRDISSLSPSAWILWQVIDNHISEEGYLGLRDSGMVNLTQGYWGAAVADHDREDIILTQKYYGLGQFTRYIRPGMFLVPCGSDGLAAYSPEEQKLVIVAVNASGDQKKTRFQLPDSWKIAGTVRAVRTSGSSVSGEHWAELPEIAASSNSFDAELKEYSVTTFILDQTSP